jgi:hypothetical protein
VANPDNVQIAYAPHNLGKMTSSVIMFGVHIAIGDGMARRAPHPNCQGRPLPFEPSANNVDSRSKRRRNRAKPKLTWPARDGHLNSHLGQRSSATPVAPSMDNAKVNPFPDDIRASTAVLAETLHPKA